MKIWKKAMIVLLLIFIIFQFMVQSVAGAELTAEQRALIVKVAVYIDSMGQRKTSIALFSRCGPS